MVMKINTSLIYLVIQSLQIVLNLHFILNNPVRYVTQMLTFVCVYYEKRQLVLLVTWSANVAIYP